MYAVGDVARWPHPLAGRPVRIEHWTNAIEQAGHVARRIANPDGELDPFATVPYFWSDQYGARLQAYGFPGAGAEVEVFHGDLASGKFAALYRHGGRLTAAVGIGSPKQVLAGLRQVVAELHRTGSRHERRQRPQHHEGGKAMTDDAAMLSYPFTRDGACPFAPPKEYKHLRDTEPISKVRLYDGREAWIFTRHEDIRTVLAHPAASAETLREEFPFLNPADKVSKTAQSFQRWDDPRHAERRRMLMPYFTIKRVEEMRPRVRGMIGHYYDAMIDAGPADRPGREAGAGDPVDGRLRPAGRRLRGPRVLRDPVRGPAEPQLPR